MTESRQPKRWFSKPSAPEPVAATIPNGVRLAAAWSWRLLLIAAAVAAAAWIIVQLRIIVVPVLVALLLAALLVPFVNFLRRHRWPRWLAITVAMLALIVSFGGLLTLGVSQIVRGSDELARQTVIAWDDLKVMLADSPLHVTDAQWNDAIKQVQDFLRSDQLLSGALELSATVGHLLAGLLLVLFATLFFVIDGRGIWNWVVGIFPRTAQAAVDGAGAAGWKTLTMFVRVQILVASIDAIGIGLGAFLLGVPLAIPIAILVFLGSFIPIVGAVFAGAIAVFVALVYNGPVIALIMLGVVLLVQQVEGHVLQPLIMGTAVKVHPLAVVLVVATGSFLAGIPGALFAVPIAATANVMVKYISAGAWKPDAPPLSPTALWSVVPAGRRMRRELP